MNDQSLTNQFRNPQDGKSFLKSKNAVEISRYECDTFIRIALEIETPDGTEVWIERESKLEEPEYYYSLFQFQGEMPETVENQPLKAEG